MTSPTHIPGHLCRNRLCEECYPEKEWEARERLGAEPFTQDKECCEKCDGIEWAEGEDCHCHRKKSLLERIGELKRDTFPSNANPDAVHNLWYNDALDDVLKIVREYE